MSWQAQGNNSWVAVHPPYERPQALWLDMSGECHCGFSVVLRVRSCVTCAILGPLCCLVLQTYSKSARPQLYDAGSFL